MFDSVHLHLTLLGLSRLKPHQPRRAAPITPEILLQIHACLDLSQPKHAAFWALFLFAFFTFSRKSNLVPNKVPIPRYSHHITRADIRITESAMVASFRSSKTNQYADRVHVVPVLSLPGSPLCPVQAFRHMVRLCPAASSAPAFVLPSGRASYRCITYPMYNAFIKDAISAIGLRPSAFSSHSFRRGGATFAFQAKVPAELIKSTGDWKSSAYLLYLDLSFQDKVRVSSAMLSRLIQTGTAFHAPL